MNITTKEQSLLTALLELHRSTTANNNYQSSLTEHLRSHSVKNHRRIATFLRINDYTNSGEAVVKWKSTVRPNISMVRLIIAKVSTKQSVSRSNTIKNKRASDSDSHRLIKSLSDEIGKLESTLNEKRIALKVIKSML